MGRKKMGKNEQKEEEENDIVKNYQSSLAKFDRNKKSGGFQSMGITIGNSFFVSIDHLILYGY